jgi:putative salt-induced outer membrane protein YdiY
MTGEFTIDWTKVKELTTTDQFAVIPKNVKVKRGADLSTVPQGSINVSDQKIEVKKQPNAPPAQTIPVPEAGYVVDQTTFRDAILRNPGFFHAWTGSIAAGVSLVEATQKSNTFSGAVNLVRATPKVSWLDPRDRTTFDLNFAYGKLTQPDTPEVKTNLYHIGVEHDRYFTPRVYAFGAAAFDHNFSQGLDLQQTYGGGLGWTVINTQVEQLDLKAGMSYIRQNFQGVLGLPTQNQNLIGSTFGETYRRKLPLSIVFNQGIGYTQAWNNTDAYSIIGNAGLVFPVYKHFGFTVSAIDNFLNNPPPGFKKNSVQFTMGLSYSVAATQ